MTELITTLDKNFENFLGKGLDYFDGRSNNVSSINFAYANKAISYIPKSSYSSINFVCIITKVAIGILAYPLDGSVGICFRLFKNNILLPLAKFLHIDQSKQTHLRKVKKTIYIATLAIAFCSLTYFGSQFFSKKSSFKEFSIVFPKTTPPSATSNLIFPSFNSSIIHPISKISIYIIKSLASIITIYFGAIVFSKVFDIVKNHEPLPQDHEPLPQEDIFKYLNVLQTPQFKKSRNKFEYIRFQVRIDDIAYEQMIKDENFNDPNNLNAIQEIIEKIQTAIRGGNNFIAIPILVNDNHYVTILIDIRNKTIEYYDPKGVSVELRENIRNFLQDEYFTNNFDPEIKVFNKENHHQHGTDGTNCGAYVLNYLQRRIQGTSSEQLFKTSIPRTSINLFQKNLKEILRD